MSLPVKNLVFEGGGVKGIAYGGALQALKEKGMLERIKRVAGTSAGAINAALMAIGYTEEEISQIIAGTDFKDFKDGSFFPVNCFRLIKHYGWFKGNDFKDWMGELIEKKTGNKNFTFQQLEKAIEEGETSFKLLYTVSTNLSKQQAEVFSTEQHQETAINEAVRMSMSIPVFFQSVENEGDYFVDGGVSYNYPVNLFDHERYLDNPANTMDKEPDEKGNVFNSETLGFRLDSTDVIKYSKNDWQVPPLKIDGIQDYLSGLLGFMMEMANKSHLEADDWKRTIFIDTKDVKTTDFDLPESKIKALIDQGRTGVEKYFAWRTQDDVWSKYPV